jgi:hypothetical protein
MVEREVGGRLLYNSFFLFRRSASTTVLFRSDI